MSGFMLIELSRQRSGFTDDLALLDTTPTPDTILLDHVQTEQIVVLSDFIAVKGADAHLREDPGRYQRSGGPQELALLDTTPTPDTTLIDLMVTEQIVISYLLVEIVGGDPTAPQRRSAFFPIILRLLAEGYRN